MSPQSETHSETIDEFLATQNNIEATLEVDAGDPNAVTIMPLLGYSVCNCNSGFSVSKKYLRPVTPTGEIKSCCGKRLRPNQQAYVAAGHESVRIVMDVLQGNRLRTDVAAAERMLEIAADNGAMFVINAGTGVLQGIGHAWSVSPNRCTRPALASMFTNLQIGKRDERRAKNR